MDTTQNLLTEELNNQIEALGELAFGSDEHRKAVDDVTKLAGVLNDMERIKHEYQEKENRFIEETDSKTKQRKMEVWDMALKHGLVAAGIIVALGKEVWGTNKTLKFEQTGIVTTFAGKEWLKRLFKK